MRHNKAINHLGRKSGHRKALLANLATALILNKRIETTVAKAKALKMYVEPLITKSKELDEESLRMRHLLLTKLSDMGLSVRAYNCLKAADIDTFADLVSYSRAELMKFRNFGRKSLNEIDLLVEKMKLSFGMDVTKYNIEPKKKNV